jgi:hypothetical protein
MTRIGLVVWLALACGAPAWAQTQPSAPASSTTFLSRAAFRFEWAKTISSDQRFNWDAHLGMDVDLVTFRTGRITFTADYEAVLGAERRGFDLNHGNYILESAVTFNRGPVEISGVFHHVSRHLSDRSNEAAISWNTYGVRVERRVDRGRASLLTRYQAAVAVQQAFVDYRWTTDLRLRAERRVHERASVFVGGTGGFIGVDARRVGRGRQCGAAIEGGVRLTGTAAGVEIFAGYERRVDAFPTERTRVRMFSIGFRLTSR